jgi:hypothetical protein
MKSTSTARTLLIAFLFMSVPFVIYSQGTSCGASGNTLTPSATCNATAGNLKNAPNASPTGACGGATSTTTYSGWYQFTATSSNPLITVSGLGSSLTSATTYIEVFSGSCGSLTSLACQNVSTSLSLSGLTSGTVYYLRVYVTTNPNSGGNPSQYDFTICIQTRNDDCAGAVSLTTSASCSNITETLNNATATTGLPAGCESGGTHYDVWYKFVAASTFELISLSGRGSNFTNPELQLYSGACGSLTSLQCGTTSITATGLTIGSTYYVRVSNVGTAIATNGGFSICVYHPTGANFDYGKSYVNITRNSGGGTINPGDTLEIRATLVVRSLSLDSVAFFDTLHNTGGIRLIPGTIALRTNEGKIYRRDSPVKSAFTDAFDSDAGYTYQNGLDTIVRINIGTGANNVARGSLSNTSRPSVFGNTCIIMATYRVVVYAAYGSTINLGGGVITIKDPNTTISSNLSFSTRNAIVYSSPGLCPNAVSASNAIGGDFNGTFGTATGSAPLTKNRGSSSNVPGYTYANFTTGAPQDYYYGITNNTSGSGSSFTTTTTWAKPDASAPTHRVFNVWDITGDHTGATNTAKGNPPCDTTKAYNALTNPCGYMLVINSAYKTDTAFQYSVTNLCPNTYYEISAWLKNICYKCSCDSNGVSSSGGVGYIPFAPNDSSGVQPNLAFDINGTDYYTTGNIVYAGVYPTTQAGSDSTNKWVKRGFTYRTGSSQTSLTLSIRNNAPGGGGNDWALDDISLATCLPNMQYSPSLNPVTCQNNPGITIMDTVRSYFNNYSEYKWQRSTDGGSTWADIAGTTGTTTPTWNGSAYQYITSYNIPQGNTTLADSGSRYRVVTATTSTNLGNSSCLFTDGISIITLTVNNCVTPLNIDLLSFNGKLNNSNANLLWVTSKENEPVSFAIERSNDGVSFSNIGTLNGHGNYPAEINYYDFYDPVAISGKAWYRIAMVNKDGMKKYSRTISLNDKTIEFGLTNVINPFSNELNFEIAAPENARVEVSLVNLSGKIVRKESFTVYEGVNSLSIRNTERIPAAMYILQIKNNEKLISTKLMKK